jgi:D-alanyl-D-alanine carboxypeptidase/D-alanyl-D-alanine-endopeptidase (penicillin-binding protein 4)
VRRVTGSVRGDESFFDSRRVGPAWKPGFYGNESPPLSALTVDRTFYHGTMSPEPALTAAAVFRSALVAAGVKVAGQAGTGRATGSAFALASVTSAPVAALVHRMNRESDNFMAELLLKQIGAVGAITPATSARGATVVRATLAAGSVPLTGVRIVDGSGLSPSDRLTAGALVGILRAAWSDPEVRGPFIDSLPIAGRTGTLADRLRKPPARGHVAAKTGTTSTASTLAGYVRRHYAFAVLNNGRPVNADSARRAQDRFALVLATE